MTQKSFNERALSFTFHTFSSCSLEKNVVFSARSGSQATLDSLDLARFSEDGERSSDERVAVLEFELRKAKETINALRNNLTVATGEFFQDFKRCLSYTRYFSESETSTPVKKGGGLLIKNSIKPHEQRALNFLINEYLLLHGYKLTSITFADENENQVSIVTLFVLTRSGINVPSLVVDSYFCCFI